MFKKLLLLGLLFSLAACQTAPKSGGSSSAASGDYSALFDSIMQQERSWAGLTSKKITVRGVDITYSEGGPADGEPMILLHGFTGDRNNWNRMAKYLTGKYHVYIPDLPGHGESASGLELDYSMPEQSSVMKAFVDELGLEKYHLAGNSMGGGLAIQWATFRPQQVLSLALIDSAGLYEHKGPVMQDMLAGKFDLIVKQKGDMRRVINLAMADKPFLPQELLEVMEKRQIARYPVYKKIIDGLMKTQKSMGPGMFGIALKSFRMPVLILWGAEDKIFEAPVTKELERNIKNHKTVIMPGVGHVPIFEAPKDSAEAYTRFLEGS